MRALLLAAGLGTRLRPVTDHIPKCLVDINGRPLLDYWLELLSSGGIKQVLINLHYMPYEVRKYLAQCRYPIDISTVHEVTLLGTAGTIRKNKDYFKNKPLMLIHADNLSKFDMQAFINRYEQRESTVEITMMTFETDAPETCGIVELDAKNNVCAFHEKTLNPPGKLANGAVYILSPKVVESISKMEKDIIDFSTEIIPKYINRINTYHNEIYHRDIGNLKSLEMARVEYLKKINHINI